MIQYIIAGVGAIAAGAAYLLFSQNKQTELSEFDDENINTGYHKFFSPTDETKAKTHATTSMNKLIEKVKGFKIGKTGSPDDRNKQHTDFKKMYVIVESKSEEFIEKLESIYNEKFISNKRNGNFKTGSAGKMTGKNGRYFLYFIAN